MSPPNTPYKFLDFYTLDDADIFFGREQETRILLSDVVVNRLVVLFATTGTGKTSLINAGVRPLLHDRGYATLFIRVRKDPAESARAELMNNYPNLTFDGEALTAQLENVAKHLKQPIVLFFDQFEEFFTYSLKEDPDAARQFVADVATLYHNVDSGVHIVLSMREEWFVELDVFRDEIPNIFHSESNLRLRRFDREQARAAIQGPAKAFGVTIEDDLVDRLIGDLSEGGTIEPAQIQIVCDTLWRNREGNSLTLAHYTKLGQSDTAENIARQVLLQRLEQEFAKIDSEQELELLEKLLPQLRTPPPPPFTKYVRDTVALVKTLGADESSLLSLIRKLEESQFVRTSIRDKLPVVELSHDYLVERLEDLQGRVRTIWPQRVLRTDMEAHRTSGQLMSPEHLATISKSKGYLTLNSFQAEFLFRSALDHGFNMDVWFDAALKRSIDVWNIIRNKISQDAKKGKASNAIDLLGELIKIPDAFALLEWTLAQRQVADYTIYVLSRSESVEALNLLTTVLEKDELSAQAKDAVKILSRFAKSAEVTASAKAVLTGFGKSQGIEVRDEYRAGLGRDINRGIKPPFGFIVDALNKGQVIPLLGPGVLTNWRNPQTKFSQNSSYLPTGSELAHHLAASAGLPQPEELGLLQAGGYHEMIAGRSSLRSTLHAVFDNDYIPTPLHRYLAQLSMPLLILTTCYDDLLERAFQDLFRPYDVVIQADGARYMGDLLWRKYGADKLEAVEPNRFDIDLKGITVIYKINGSVDRSNSENDQYLITEDDQISLLTRMANNRAIPAVFAEALVTRGFLFLGYTADHWHNRALLRGLLSFRRRHAMPGARKRSWAVLSEPSTSEQFFFRSLGVDIFDMVFDEFVEALQQQHKVFQMS